MNIGGSGLQFGLPPASPISQFWCFLYPLGEESVDIADDPWFLPVLQPLILDGVLAGCIRLTSADLQETLNVFDSQH
jgi:hypothetical protein